MKKIFKAITVILLLMAVVVTAGYFSKKYNVFEKEKENNVSDSTEKKDDDSVSEKISFSFDLNKLNSTYFEEEKITIYSNTNDHKKALDFLNEEEGVSISDPDLTNLEVVATSNMQDEDSQYEAYFYMFAKTVSLKIDSDKIDELDSIKEIKIVIDDVTYEIKLTDTKNASINGIPCSVSFDIVPLDIDELFFIRLAIIPGCGLGVADDTQFVFSTLNLTSFATENIEINF